MADVIWSPGNSRNLKPGLEETFELALEMEP